MFLYFPYFLAFFLAKKLSQLFPCSYILFNRFFSYVNCFSITVEWGNTDHLWHLKIKFKKVPKDFKYLLTLKSGMDYGSSGCKP
jgi:hypothetical protein